MQLVIDISEDLYEGIERRDGALETEYVCDELMKAVDNGTRLPKIGRWILTQRGKYIDINCSECGNTRIKEFAYNYTVDEIDMQEIKDLVVTSKMNYCECCGAKMEMIKDANKKE